MGNQTSTVSTSSAASQVDVDRLRPFSRGSLGLSRNELDKRCIPSGLYADCDWEKNAIRRLIADGRIAARQKGLDSPENDNNVTEECPICFLNYSQVNTTNCCHASMCTECYLQVRPQKQKEPTCPFCNSTEFCVFVDKKKTPSEVCPSETETSLSESSGSSTTSTNTKKKSTASIAPDVPSPKSQNDGFGSQLEKDERFQRMRKRSESFASQNSDAPSTPKRDQDIIHSIAMSAEERQRLEEEMKAQHHHPLVLRLEHEAQERRLENDRAYQNSARSQSANRNSHLARRMRTARNWDQLATFLDQREELNDMSALESAILYTRLAEASGQTTNSGTNSEDSNDSNSNHQDQLDGFPLLRTLLTHDHQGSSSRSLRSSRRQRHPFMRSGLGLRNRGMSDVAMATASLMMRGISEEEQMAMAIAASMREQEQPNTDENNENDENPDADTDEIDQAGETNSDASNGAEENDQDTTEAEAPAQVESKHRDEESTITELARVVTDNSDTDTIPAAISA